MKPFIVVEPYLKDAPEGWTVHRLRRVSELIEDTNSDANASLLSLTIGGELLPRADDVQPPSAEYLLKYGLVRVGDLVVNPMWLTGGSIGVSSAAGAVSPEYRIYRFGRYIHPRFIHHLVRSDPFMHQYRLLVRAETTFDRRVTKEDFRELPLLLPPVGTQRAIADFLDRETARIDALITKKQRMIELFKDRRQALITSAVTGETTSQGGGVSGFNMTRVKFSARINQSALSESTDPDREVRYVDISSVGRGVLVAEPEVMTFSTAPSRARRLVSNGDTIVSTVRTYLRAVLPIRSPDTALVVSTGFAVLTPRSDVDPKYFAWAVQSDPFVDEIAARSVGVSYPAINASEVGDIRIPVPVLADQRAIADFLDRETARIDAITVPLAQQIVLLRERRQALITAAVTGELDVPRVAA